MEASSLQKTLLGIHGSDPSLKKKKAPLHKSLTEKAFSITGSVHLCPWVCTSVGPVPPGGMPASCCFGKPTLAETWAPGGVCGRKVLVAPCLGPGCTWASLSLAGGCLLQLTFAPLEVI